MTSLITFIDAAYPPQSMKGAEGLCFYIGGDTPHVWTIQEVNSFNARYLLPVWVRSNPDISLAGEDATTALNALVHTYHAPEGSLVALDSETSADPGYVREFVTRMNAGGYPVIDYGSVSTVFGNDNPDGYYWSADWTGFPHFSWKSQMTQYISFPSYDLSEAVPNLPFWQPGKPAPAPKPQETDMQFGFLTTAPESVPFPGASPVKLSLYQDKLGNLAFPVAVRVAARSRSTGRYQIQSVTLEGPVPVDITFSAHDVDAVSLWVMSPAAGHLVGYAFA